MTLELDLNTILSKRRLTQLPDPGVRKTGWPWGMPISANNMSIADGLLPKVTLVTPSYNQGQFIEATIRSVLLQDYPNVEYFVIDGGSTDNSIEIIRKYEPWLAGWVSEKDMGQADAINKGWQQSSGEFLGWLNSDDVLTPNSISNAIRHFHEFPDIDFIYGDLEYIDANDRFLRLVTYQDFDLKNMVQYAGWISQPGSLMRRSVFERVGLLDITLDFQMDLDYWLRAGLENKFGYLRTPLARFRAHSGSKSYKQTHIAARDIMTVYSKLFSRSDLPSELRKVETQSWSSAHLYAARSWYSGNHLNNAFREIWRACMIYPRILFSSNLYLFLPKLIALTLIGGRDSALFKRLKGQRTPRSQNAAP